MNETIQSGNNIPVKYTIRIDFVCDMLGYVVEIIDRYNSRNYTLSGIYPERAIAMKEADAFVNDLFEKEISMYVN